ncbi:amidohydrolase family protein [Nocardioides marmorisolisilvae]|nr:amidohydrolase family protein [Nocardioides marmorisolisilvae]
MIDGTRVVDAHQHFWDLDAGYDWLGPEYGPINRSFGVDDVEPLAAAAGVDDVVLVQADDTLADTEAMIAIADAWPRVAGIVGWAPLADDVALPPVLDWFAGDSRLVGVRHLMHTEADPDWVVHADVGRGLGALEEAGLSFDLVPVLPRHLEHVPTLAERYPELTLVIDHLAKPPIADGEFTVWSELIAVAAKYPNVSAKISGLDTAAGPDRYTAAEIGPYVEHALAHFGPSRLMFGSDWPVNVLAEGYAAWWSTVNEILAGLSADERGLVLGGTATAIYKLGASS